MPTEPRLPPIRIGVSSCLLGNRVRYDGGHKREPFLTHSKLNLMTRHYVSDTARASAVLDFQPAISLEQGLDETLSWLRAGGMRPHM